MLRKALKIGMPALLALTVLTAGAGAIGPTVPVAEAHPSCDKHQDHARWRLVQHHHIDPWGRRVVHHHHWWRGSFSITMDCPPHRYPYPRPLPLPPAVASSQLELAH